ncbi:MAG: hypothetical protein V3T17_11865 [Pseudomonadales bacterium]
MRSKEVEALLQQVLSVIGTPLSQLKEEQENLSKLVIDQQLQIIKLKQELYGSKNELNDVLIEYDLFDSKYDLAECISKPVSIVEMKRMLGNSLRHIIGNKKKQPEKNFADRVSDIEKDFFKLMTMVSLSNDPSSYKIQRYFSCSLYLDGSLDYYENSRQLIKAIKKFMELIGFELVMEFNPEFGSIYKRFFHKTKEALSQPEVQKRLEKLERAFELKTIGKDQSSINKSDAEAVVMLIGALENSDSAIIRIGTIVISKNTDDSGKNVTLVRNLSQAEIMEIESNPGINSEPEILKKILECDDENT